MTRASNLLLLYASTSGRTRVLFKDLAIHSVTSINTLLIELGPEPPILPITPIKVAVFGSPTYGQGELHYRWQEHLPAVMDALAGIQTVGVIGIGDSRYHARTYCRSLEIFSEALGRGPMSKATCHLLSLDVRMFRTWKQQSLPWIDRLLAAALEEDG